MTRVWQELEDSWFITKLPCLPCLQLIAYSLNKQQGLRIYNTQERISLWVWYPLKHPIQTKAAWTIIKLHLPVKIHAGLRDGDHWKSFSKLHMAFTSAAHLSLTWFYLVLSIAHSVYEERLYHCHTCITEEGRVKRTHYVNFSVHWEWSKEHT